MAPATKSKDPASYAGKYVVEHSLIGGPFGGHFQGEYVEITEDDANGLGELAKTPGADDGQAEHPIARLVRLKAIRKATDEDEQDENGEERELVRWGKGHAEVPRPFPAVPFEQAAVAAATSTAEEGKK